MARVNGIEMDSTIAIDMTKTASGMVRSEAVGFQNRVLA